MAKNETTATTERRIELRLAVKLGEYEGKPYVEATLLDPFPQYSEDFNDIRIAPRWDKDAAIFKFRMKQYLRTSDDVVLQGYCKPESYVAKNGKDKGKKIYYPAMFFKVPYTDKEIEFGFKRRKEKDKDGNVVYSDSGDAYVFREIVSEMWGGSFEPVPNGSLID